MFILALYVFSPSILISITFFNTINTNG
jgi:hypothetical protein